MLHRESFSNCLIVIVPFEIVVTNEKMPFEIRDVIIHGSQIELLFADRLAGGSGDDREVPRDERKEIKDRHREESQSRKIHDQSGPHLARLRTAQNCVRRFRTPFSSHMRTSTLTDIKTK